MHKTNIVCIFFTLEGYHRMLIDFNFCKSYYIAGDKYLLFFIPALSWRIYIIELFNLFQQFQKFQTFIKYRACAVIIFCTDSTRLHRRRLPLSCAFHFRYYISSLRLWSSKSIVWLHAMYASYILFRNNFFCKFK